MLRVAVSAIALAGMAMTPACGNGADGTVLGIPNRSRPKLLYAATNEPTGITDLTYLRDRVTRLNQGPFDGLTLDVGLGDEPWGDVSYTRAMFDPEVELLRSIPFAKLSDNFQMFNAARGAVDWFDDPAFAILIGNARVAAEVVRDAGLRGIFFDVEAFADAAWTLPRVPEGTPFASFETQARARGAQFMTAMLEVMPDITILLTVSFSEVFRAVCLAGASPEEDRYSMLPAFLDGMFQARATLQSPAQIIDGFVASYAARNPESFPVYRELIQGNWRGLQERWLPGIVSFRFGTGVIDWDDQARITCAPDIQGKLTRDLPVAFGVRFDADTLIGGDFHTVPTDFGMNFFTPDTLATVLTAALASAEKYVFLWSHTVDWLGASSARPPPAEYVQAVTRARAGAP